MAEETQKGHTVSSSGLIDIKHERETYPWLKKVYEKRGFQFQRFEGAPSVPDIWVGRGDDYFWLEVKVYRGKKKLEHLTMDDVKDMFEPGQARFRFMSNSRCPGHHCVVVFNKIGQFIYIQ